MIAGIVMLPLLLALTMQLGLARLDLPPGSPAAGTVAATHDQAKQLMAELREMAAAAPTPAAAPA